MKKDLFYNILDSKRKAILPFLKNFKDEFYLAGGTGLALQIGHRDSIDFDFFSQKTFDTKKLFEKIQKIFKNQKLKKIQEEKNTLTVTIDKEIKLSFFYYPYKLVKEKIDAEYFFLASKEDIGCMKLSSIISRAVMRDFVDLYFLLQEKRLLELLLLSEKKFPELDRNLILKSLVYFEDISPEPINFKKGKKITLLEIKNFLVGEVKKYLNKEF